MTGMRRWAMVLAGMLLVSCSAPPSGGAGAPAARPTTAAPAGATSGAQPAATPAPAAARSLEPANFVVTAIALSISAAAVAQELGYFAEEGIAAELTYIAGAAQPAQAL